ncbi:MAG: DNA polymerase I [Beijerinckiaceae bacterium]|nr:DNA polymerase I [Beijerinckiaceae bacterium]
MQSGDHVFLVDGSGYIFRAYHALPPLTRKSDGLPIGAVSGFCNMLLKLLRDTVLGEKPTHLAVIFDAGSKTFRNDLYDQYKATRTEPPEDLVPQFGLIREATRAFDIACIEQDNYEADDLIATYTRLAVEAGATVTIVSSDKDLMQLVSDTVVMYDTMKDKRIGRAEVIEKFGLGPERVVEVQALAGDTSDNVPGVPGIGIKTAAQLLTEYGDLDTLLARAHEIKQPKRREALIENADKARISRRLVQLETNVPLNVPADRLAVHEPDVRNLVAFLKAMELTTITRRVAELYGVNIAEIEPDSRLVGDGARVSRTGMGEEAGAAKPIPGEKVRYDAVALSRAALPPSSDTAADGFKPQDLVQVLAAAAQAQPIDHSAYQCVTTIAELDRWIAEAFEAGSVAIDTETNSLDAMQAALVGVSMAVAPGRACYIPLLHRSENAGDLFGGAALLDGQAPFDEALARLKPLLESPAVLKIGQNIKFDWLVFAQHDIIVAPYDDTMLMSYALDAGKNGHGMDELSEIWLSHKPVAFKEVAGSGKTFKTFDYVALDKATAYAAEDADVTLRLWRVLKPRLAAEGLTKVYERLERPMIDVLARMERRGIAIDRQILSRLSGEFAQGMARLEAEIHELAGETFNIGSPKQLGDILFGKMGFEGAKKTPSGTWATGARVLEDLALQGHELPRRLLDWRQISKLKSTYTDALPTFVNPRTKRVHTSFALAATTTGRLSSSDPNIQNIPVRNEAGRKIRQAFIAQPGMKLVSADYSQIELRVLAHVADIPQLRTAFSDGVDIHAMTASEMFGVPVEGMPSEVRRRAKAINFGIIYGISAFGLANQLSIGREEAGDYIKKYFERFPGIRDYIENTKRFARAHGYVETIFGRKCHYPQINTSKQAERAFFERAAINAPIQGSAADIIRKAMIRMDAALAAAKTDAQMLLQVHDELVFEVPESQVETAIPVIRSVMIDAPHPAIHLAVPLQVDARAALNWDEAH